MEIFKQREKKRIKIRLYFEMGRIIKRLHVSTSLRVFEEYIADDMKDAFPVFWTILNSLRPFHHIWTKDDKDKNKDKDKVTKRIKDPTYAIFSKMIL